MWLVAGLGNPGDDYSETRHNAGFMVVDTLATRHSIHLKNKKASYICGRGFIEDQGVILMKPLTFMNRSGMAVMEVLRWFDDIDNLLVIHDDLDLEPGMIRIREKGSSGGHNGIQSIIDFLGSQEFARLKIGIGRPERILPEKYVLRPFNKKERILIDEAIETAADAVEVIACKGLTHAQNLFHRK
jgi:PTH1 family peptidyl-tRNA hydrolase